MSCNCRICKYGREVKKHLNAIPEPHREFFRKLYDYYSMAEEEREYLKMKLDQAKKD